MIVAVNAFAGKCIAEILVTFCFLIWMVVMWLCSLCENLLNCMLKILYLSDNMLYFKGLLFKNRLHSGGRVELEWYAFLDSIQAYGFHHHAPPSQTPASYTPRSRGPKWISLQVCDFMLCILLFWEWQHNLSIQPRNLKVVLGSLPPSLTAQTYLVRSAENSASLHNSQHNSARLCF